MPKPRQWAPEESAAAMEGGAPDFLARAPSAQAPRQAARAAPQAPKPVRALTLLPLINPNPCATPSSEGSTSCILGPTGLASRRSHELAYPTARKWVYSKAFHDCSFVRTIAAI